MLRFPRPPSTETVIARRPDEAELIERDLRLKQDVMEKVNKLIQEQEVPEGITGRISGEDPGATSYVSQIDESH